MPTFRLVAKVDSEAEDSFLVRAPAVGMADGVPAEGVYLNPSEGFLTLTILNRRYVVQLPRNVQGMVTERFIEDTWTAVDYGQPLLRLSLARDLAVGRAAADHGGGQAQGTEDLIAVPAPSDGVFYRKASPDAPPYVREGSEVTTGTVLGLVEVMKSFNQIAYGGAGLPERGRVERILAEDAAEVAYGQTLFLVRPG
jgi:acetyl-CoA carboxylase biotin carboxyl carrier protein